MHHCFKPTGVQDLWGEENDEESFSTEETLQIRAVRYLLWQQEESGKQLAIVARCVARTSVHRFSSTCMDIKYVYALSTLVAQPLSALGARDEVDLFSAYRLSADARQRVARGTGLSEQRVDTLLNWYLTRRAYHAWCANEFRETARGSYARSLEKPVPRTREERQEHMRTS